jgi:hypothetical protein
MTYKETLFFVGKCLTITLEEKNRIEIEEQLKVTKIDWDSVVKLSTSHYVFPALYCNFKRVGFLQYLPEELVNYMKHITDLNRERNQQIIIQARELNCLLLGNNITPIFLKGTGNLLEGLYEDIAERMVGDIDFIFSKEDYLKAIEVLHKNEYSKVDRNSYAFIEFKHYSRLIKENRIAAVEIHKELLIEKYAHEFNFSIVERDTKVIDEIIVMSYDNQLSLSIIAKQINDDGFHYKNMALRNAYDVFLLSKKTIAKEAFTKFNGLKNPLNCFLAICYEVFGKVDSLKYLSSKKTANYITVFNKNLINQLTTSKKNKTKAKQLLLKKRLFIIYKSIFDTRHRNYLAEKLSDKNWIKKEILTQLGLKKTNPNV